VRLSQADLDKLEAIARKRHAKLMKTKDIFEVNVVCVRTVVDRGRVRSKVHEVRWHAFVSRPSTLNAPVCRSLSFVPGDHIAKTCTFPVDMATLRRYITR
jgi:hypothetical protein